MKHFIGLITACLLLSQVNGQLITMSNSCYKQVQQGNTENKAGNYQQALSTFETVLKKCSAKDAKEQGNAGKARALNGLKRYTDAAAAAEAVLKVNKNSIYGYFERGVARSNLNQLADATADFNKVIELTEKNKNIKERATIYAKIAELDWQQQMYPDAYNNLATAIKLDPTNADFFLQRGDMFLKEKKYDDAFSDYDMAVSMGKADKTVYQTRANARIQMAIDKYHTSNASELNKKLSSQEKQNICTEIKKAQDLGLRDFNMDMFSATVCQ